MSEFFLQIFCELNMCYSIIIEDDKRVAYAYLYEKENIIGDVWLYNQLDSPMKVNWDLTNGMPLLNPLEFINDDALVDSIISENEVICEWQMHHNNEFLKEVNLFLRGQLIAKLKAGAMRGWSTFVKKDGPLAKVWVDKIQ